MFTPEYTEKVANKAPGHEEIKPEMFSAETQAGFYEDYTDQVQMPKTPEHYDTVRFFIRPFCVLQCD